MKNILLAFLFYLISCHTSQAALGYDLAGLAKNHITSYCRVLLIWQKGEDGYYHLVDNPDKNYYTNGCCQSDCTITRIK